MFYRLLAWVQVCVTQSGMKTVQVRFRDGDGERVAMAAEGLGLTLAQYVRMAALACEVRSEVAGVKEPERKPEVPKPKPTPEAPEPEPLRPGRSPAMAAALAAQSEGDEVKACTICGALMDEGRRKEMHAGHRRDCMRWRAEA